MGSCAEVYFEAALNAAEHADLDNRLMSVELVERDYTRSVFGESGGIYQKGYLLPYDHSEHTQSVLVLRSTSRSSRRTSGQVAS